MTTNVLNPKLTLLAKLSAIAVHAEEWLSPNSHGNDLLALKSVLYDSEVQEWLWGMTELTLAPLKRG